MNTNTLAPSYSLPIRPLVNVNGAERVLSNVYDSTRDVYLMDGADIDPSAIDVDRLSTRAIHPSTVHAVVQACGVGTSSRDKGKPIGVCRILASVDIAQRSFNPTRPDAIDILSRGIQWGEYPNGARWYRVPTSDEGIGGSIYGSDTVNALFRAWHDVTHATVGVGFSAQCETMVAESMARELAALGFGALAILPIVADVVAADQWYRERGSFPRDPRSVVVRALVGFGGPSDDWTRDIASGAATLQESHVSRYLIARASRGEWRACIDDMRDSGATYARLGIGD